jgi:hypothetical protein
MRYVEADSTHVDQEEAFEGNDLTVGDGSPDTAPWVEVNKEEPQKTWWPTRKWWYATVIAAGGLLTMLLTGESEVTDEETIALITFGVQRAASFIMPNDETPGGVGVRYK